MLLCFFWVEFRTFFFPEPKWSLNTWNCSQFSPLCSPCTRLCYRHRYFCISSSAFLSKSSSTNVFCSFFVYLLFHFGHLPRFHCPCICVCVCERVCFFIYHSLWSLPIFVVVIVVVIAHRSSFSHVWSLYFRSISSQVFVCFWSLDTNVCVCVMGTEVWMWFGPYVSKSVCVCYISIYVMWMYIIHNSPTCETKCRCIDCRIIFLSKFLCNLNVTIVVAEHLSVIE